tara:strand:- start:3728 stop:4087 length:360 start_codon:yes stop_codon:yes gene_type:complete
MSGIKTGDTVKSPEWANLLRLTTLSHFKENKGKKVRVYWFHPLESYVFKADIGEVMKNRVEFVNQTSCYVRKYVSPWSRCSQLHSKFEIPTKVDSYNMFMNNIPDFPRANYSHAIVELM